MRRTWNSRDALSLAVQFFTEVAVQGRELIKRLASSMGMDGHSRLIFHAFTICGP